MTVGDFFVLYSFFVSHSYFSFFIFIFHFPGSTTHLKKLQRWLIDECKRMDHQFPAGTPPVSSWPLIPTPATCPQQKNGFDCGVFSSQFGRYLSEKKPFDFQQRNALYFRHLMAYDIWNAEKDGDYPLKLRAGYWSKKKKE